MPKETRGTKRKFYFTCQLTEHSLKVLRCAHGGPKREFIAAEIETLSLAETEEKIMQKLAGIAQRLGYAREPLAIVLGLNYATCRYLKVPAQTTHEIEEIIPFQATKYLPYPAHELITGYEILSQDQEGFSHIHLTIVHKDSISRLLSIFNTLQPQSVTISLSSYGLASLYAALSPEDRGAVALLDIDAQSAEVAILNDKKLLLSRHFKLNRLQPNWENVFIDEYRKTLDAYAKELGAKLIQKIVLLGIGDKFKDLLELVAKKTTAQTELCSYENRLLLTPHIVATLQNSGSSCASLLGASIKDIEPSLNLLPALTKEKIKLASQNAKRLRSFALAAAIFLLWFLAGVKNLHNKKAYLAKLKQEVVTITKEARPLEELEQRIRALTDARERKTLILDALRELHEIMPEGISLTAFDYASHEGITLRGESQELTTVFALAAKLKLSPAYSGFKIKVQYASKKNTRRGEAIGFEVVCTKK